MSRRATILLAALGVALALCSEASAGTVAESHTSDGNRTLVQRFILIGKAIDYNVVADDPDGLFPFCATVQLEKRTRRGWRALDKGGKRSFRHECLKSPEQARRSTSSTHVGWDTIIYPTRRLFDKFKRGELRIHGFTNLGGDLTYRR